MTSNWDGLTPEQAPVELMEYVQFEAAAARRRVVEFLQLGGFSPDDFDPRVLIALRTVTQLESWDRAGAWSSTANSVCRVGKRL